MSFCGVWSSLSRLVGGIRWFEPEDGHTGGVAGLAIGGGGAGLARSGEAEPFEFRGPLEQQRHPAIDRQEPEDQPAAAT